MTYTPHKPPLVPESEELRARIPGWGADLDPADRPSVPRERFDPSQMHQRVERQRRPLEHDAQRCRQLGRERRLFARRRRVERDERADGALAADQGKSDDRRLRPAGYALIRRQARAHELFAVFGNPFSDAHQRVLVGAAGPAPGKASKRA